MVDEGFITFKESIFEDIKNYPKEWRLGQKVFNYIDMVYGVARAVQFEDRVDCFFSNDEKVIDLFIIKAWEKIQGYGILSQK